MSESSLDTRQISTKNVPNSGGILTMGILSLVFIGLMGMILAIIALSLSGKAMRAYEQNPGEYREGSYKNIKAGKVCAIIGLCLGALGLLMLFLIIDAGGF